MVHLREKSQRRHLYFWHSICQFNSSSAQTFCQKCVCLPPSKIALNVFDDFPLDIYSCLSIQLLWNIIIVLIWMHFAGDLTNSRTGLQIFWTIHSSKVMNYSVFPAVQHLWNKGQHRSLCYTAQSCKLSSFCLALKKKSFSETAGLKWTPSTCIHLCQTLQL